jgi:S1-C subfamily serine protease
VRPVLILRLLLSIAIVFLIATVPEATRRAGADEPTPTNSVVKIFTTKRRPDLIRPWRKLDAEEVSGTGVVIDGQRILTNAHVVTHASRIRVQPDQSGDQFTATVEAVGPDIDLAVLKLTDESYFDKHSPIVRAKGLPKIRDTVHVAGYPQGGEALSMTRGIVSRIEYVNYYYSREGVRVQIDAAVNPGNSGGPALVDGKMIGIVFSTLNQAENISYIIPIEEIDLFLEDVKDGVYDGKPTFHDKFQNVQNEALRAKLRLPKGTYGMMVVHPDRDDPSYPLKARDVITRIGDSAIDSAGKVEVEGGLRLQFDYLVQKLAKDGSIRVSVLRDGKTLTLDVPVLTRRAHPSVLPDLFDAFPSYFVWGPLVFSAATEDYVDQFEHPMSAGVWFPHFARQQSPLITRYGARPDFEGERVVILTTVLSHRLAQGYRSLSSVIVKDVDGVKIRNLRHLAERLRDAKGDHVVFSFYDRDAELLVLNRREAVEAAEEIQAENTIRKAYSDDLKDLFESKK